jgi:hypothetical protein
MSINQSNMGGIELPDNREQLQRAGDQVDFEIESSMMIELPEGRFTERMLNRLVDVLNKYQPMMEFESFEKVNGEQTQLPLEIAQMVMMITAAAEDAEVPLEINLAEVETDAELASVIGQLDKLVKNADFKRFLEEELFGVEDDEEVVEEEVVEEEEDMDEMFARRM